MISKELLSEVLDFGGKEVVSIEQQGTSLTIHLEPTDVAFINLFELASMCKKWAFYKGYSINYSISPFYHNISEIETIFKVCERILSELKNKKEAFGGIITYEKLGRNDDMKTYITEMQVCDEANELICIIKSFDDCTFEVKWKHTILMADQLRHVADLIDNKSIIYKPIEEWKQ